MHPPLPFSLPDPLHFPSSSVILSLVLYHALNYILISTPVSLTPQPLSRSALRHLQRRVDLLLRRALLLVVLEADEGEEDAENTCDDDDHARTARLALGLRGDTGGCGVVVLLGRVAVLICRDYVLVIMALVPLYIAL